MRRWPVWACNNRLNCNPRPKNLWIRLWDIWWYLMALYGKPKKSLRRDSFFTEVLVGASGIEPPTTTMSRWCSTTELRACNWDSTTFWFRRNVWDKTEWAHSYFAPHTVYWLTLSRLCWHSKMCLLELGDFISHLSCLLEFKIASQRIHLFFQSFDSFFEFFCR